MSHHQATSPTSFLWASVSFGAKQDNTSTFLPSRAFVSLGAATRCGNPVPTIKRGGLGRGCRLGCGDALLCRERHGWWGRRKEGGRALPGLGALTIRPRAVDGGDISCAGGGCWPVPLVPITGHPVISNRGSGSLISNSQDPPQGQSCEVSFLAWLPVGSCHAPPGQLSCPSGQASSRGKQRAPRVSLLGA